MLYKLIAFQVDKSNNYYILNYGLGCIKLFDKDFMYLRKIGNFSSGLGEFSNRLKMLQIKDDLFIVVYDKIFRRFTFFTLDGKYIKDIRFTRKVVDNFVFDGDNTFISSFDIDDKIPVIVVLDSQFNELYSFGKVIPINEKVFEIYSKSVYKNLLKGIFSGYSYTRLIKNDNSIYYIQSNPSKIMEYDKKGEFKKSLLTQTDFSTNFNSEIKEEEGQFIKRNIAPSEIYRNITFYKNKYILSLIPKPAQSFEDTSKVECYFDCYDLNGNLIDRTTIDLRVNHPLGKVETNVSEDYYSILLYGKNYFPKIIRYKINIKE
jgi:hypothetical protein